MRAAKRRKAKQAKIAAVAAQKRLEQERMAMLESEVIFVYCRRTSNKLPSHITKPFAYLLTLIVLYAIPIFLYHSLNKVMEQ